MTGIKPAMWMPGRNLTGIASELWRGCQSYWPLWDRVGAQASDLSLNSNIGTLTGMDPPTDWTVSEMGSALAFDGTNDYIACSLAQAVVDNWAMAAWMKPAGAAGSTEIPFYNGSSGNGYGIRWRDNNWGVLYDSVVIYSIVAGVVGVWQHVLITRRSGTLYLYLNGVEYTSGTDTPDIPTAGTQIGNLGASAFEGEIAQAAIWSRSLSAYEASFLSANPFFMTWSPGWEWGFSAIAAAAVGNPWYAHAQQVA